MQETRDPARVSSGRIAVTTDAACTIPKDWVIGTDPAVDPRVEVITIEAVTATAAGIHLVRAQSTAAGANQNVPIGRLEFPNSTPAHVVSTTNPQAFDKGRDIETDDQFRLRFGLRWYQLAQGDTQDRIRSLVLDNVDDVAECRVVSCRSIGPIGPISPISPGSIAVMVWSRDSTGDLIPASAETVALAQEYLDTLQVPCRSITVSAPTGPILDILAWLKVATGYVWATVADVVDDCIRAYFTDLATAGTPFILFELYARVGALAGVEDFKLEQPKANIYPDSTEALMLGQIRIQEFDSRRSFYAQGANT